MNSKSILVVDDSAVLRSVLRTALTGKGYSVSSVTDGTKAIEWLVQNPQADLIITDFHMPNLNGVGLIKRLRANARYRNTPVLVLTSGSTDAEKQEAKAAGATGWIIKPFDVDKLVSGIRKLTS